MAGVASIVWLPKGNIVNLTLGNHMLLSIRKADGENSNESKLNSFSNF